MANISDDTRRFILLNIPSIPYLEAMLLMYSDSQHQWDFSLIARRLFISDKAAATILAQLEEAGIVVAVSREPLLYQYQPLSEDLKKMIENLAETYSTNLIEVTNLIHSNCNKRAHKFADAFVWRKDS